MKNPPWGPGIATRPQPAQAANSRGPKSRAGLSPTMANGATAEMAAASMVVILTVRWRAQGEVHAAWRGSGSVMVCPATVV